MREHYLKTPLLLTILMSVLPALSLASDDHVVRSQVSFAPVTFSLGCNESSKAENRKVIERNPGAVGYIRPEECIDASRQVIDAKVHKLGIGKNEKLGNFSVILVLDDKDAKKLSALTSTGNPQPLVLSVKGRAVVSSYVQTAFEGNQFWITADSLDDAHRTADLFNQ